MIKGKSLSAYPVDRSERAILGVSPLIIEDIYDAFKKYGLIGVGVGIPAFAGEGVNTFSKKKKKNSGKGYKVPKF